MKREMKMSRVGMVIATVTLLMLCAASQADMVTVNASDDTEVRSANGNTNLDNENLNAHGDPNAIRLSYVKFDLSVVPVGQTIDAVKLFLYYYGSPQNFDADPVNIYKSSNTSWSESTLTWNLQTSWTHTLAENDTVPMHGGASQYVDWDMTSSMFAQGETVTLQLRGSANRVRFQDKRSYTPYLEVTYTPEPATMTLLLIGLPLALRRRR